MNKFLISAVTAATLLAAVVPVAQAATATTVNSTFDVSVQLASRCVANNSGALTVNFGIYTAFESASTPAPTASLTFNCTRGLASPTFSFDTGYGDVNGSGYGVLAGLNYTLSTSGSVTTAGTAATPAAASNGTPDIHTVVITGNMPSGQAGQCGTTSPKPNAAACDTGSQTHTRTLTVSY